MSKDRDFVREIVVRLKEGKTQAEIADELGVHPVTVARTVTVRSVDETAGMLAMADQGYSLSEIGEAYGVTKQRVSQIIGVQKQRGSTGRKAQINASQETWDGMMRVANRFDIPVRTREGGIDARAVVQLMDMIADGRVVVMPSRQ